MKFDDAVNQFRTLTDLRRLASAHVVDHNQLSDDELRDGVIRVKPQYLHQETVKAKLDSILFESSSKDTRVIARLFLLDALLDQYDFSLTYSQTEEYVIALEQQIVNSSNETELLDLACGDRNSQRFRDIQLHHFVLSVAWENKDTVSPDEALLLKKLRNRLRINEWDHRLLEAKLGKYPKPENELHARAEIHKVRQVLQSTGLVFPVRLENGSDLDVIPQELASVIRSILGQEIRTDAYRILMGYQKIRRKSNLIEVLEQNEIPYSRYDTVGNLVDRITGNLPPSKVIASTSPRYGLSSEELAEWCRDLGLPTSGSVPERVNRLITHYDELRPRVEAEVDQRELWYEYYHELALRDHETLRKQHIVDKDLEIESKFEEATRYLFAEKLNHSPLKQSGVNNPDGLLSLGSNYFMWDNKSKEVPGLINLFEHQAQFHTYMEKADKPTPIFLVVAPGFTEESEVEATKYHAKYFDRNIVLITADELKALAEEWSSPKNKNREAPFPLGLLAASVRFERRRLGKLF